MSDPRILTIGHAAEFPIPSPEDRQEEFRCTAEDIGPNGAALDAALLAIKQARHLVFKAQHDGTHDQDRHDAKVWMDKHAGGRCPCDRCVRDERRFQERGGSAS